MDLHVGEVQVDLLRDVEEPWGSPHKEDPNGASPGSEKLVYCHDTSYSLPYRPVINKPAKPFSCISQAKCRGSVSFDHQMF